MNVGGFQALSLIDFPHTPSAVVFTNGCQLRCNYCHNPSLALGIAPSIPEQEIKERLISLKGKVQGVVISGGEPTLQKDLPEFCDWCKEQGFKVKVDTNGRSRTWYWRDSVDYVALDLKHLFACPPESMMIEYNSFKLMLSEIRYGDGGELRCTCVRPYIDEISLLSFLEHLYYDDDTPITLYLQHCNVNENILNPEFFSEGKGKPWTQEEINDFVAKYGEKYNVKAR